MGLEFLREVAHRPWKMPNKPWVVRQDWIDLGFLHWKVDPKELRKIVPEPLEIDLFQGEAFVGVVPFEWTKFVFDLHFPLSFIVSRD